MAATKVYNYCDTPGFTKRGPGNVSVMLNGQVHHLMRIASSNNTHSCGLSYFIFDKKASRAYSPESENVNGYMLKIIVDEHKWENWCCISLCHLGLSVWQGDLTAGVNVVPRMLDSPPPMSVFAVLNCWQTGVTSFHVTTFNGSISDAKINSEKVEGLCFPLIFPHGESDCTNTIKDHLNPGRVCNNKDAQAWKN